MKIITFINREIIAKKNTIQMGLLLGLPEDAVCKFSYNFKTANTFRKRCMEESTIFSSEEKQLLKGYFAFDDKVSNDFRQEHENEVREFINCHFPDFGTGEVEYLVKLRNVKISGFYYTVSNPTYRDREFERKVMHIFEASGMGEFINSLTR